MGIGDIGVSLWGECEEQDGMHLGARGFVHAELIDPDDRRGPPARRRRDGRARAHPPPPPRRAAAALPHARPRRGLDGPVPVRPHRPARPLHRPHRRHADRARRQRLPVGACARSSSAFAPAVSGHILVRPRATGVKQEPPLPVARRARARRRAPTPALADAIRERLRERARRPDARRARAVRQPAAQRVQVEAGRAATE